ncbi:MAG: hypothetical protein QOJ35_3184 [Solirubrobacteraceae bacterium]|nr:hypothetical protein [Solirubrobacteraceae bacterium]
MLATDGVSCYAGARWHLAGVAAMHTCSTYASTPRLIAASEAWRLEQRAAGTARQRLRCPGPRPAYTHDGPPSGGPSMIKKPAASYSPGPLRTKYHRR